MHNRLILKFAICFGLIAITLAVFAQTGGFGFINYDDPPYVSDNPQVQAGLNGHAILWPFTHIHSHNWHPLTTMSHIIDCQLFGLHPGAHHLVNVAWHVAGVLLLFLLLEAMTARLWSSAFVAAVFAIHPLHAESVAWISERKDVLSGMLFFLTLLAYVAYARNRTVARYVTMSILFALGLMAKPMLVTTPLILLLLDYWPLRRAQSAKSEGQSSQWSVVRDLVAEKIPLFILSIASVIVTLIVQNKGEIGLIRLDVLPISWRITNALSACLIYIRQMFWPTDLALGYNHPGKLPILETVLAVAALSAITVAFFALRKRMPYLLMGWCWYLIMLLPVIGLVQVGGQAHADRYTYLPQIGLYIGVTWAIVDLSRSWRFQIPALGTAAIVTLIALMWRASNQVWYWHDSERLWRHALAVTSQNEVAHLGLGRFWVERKRPEEAIAEYEAAAKIGEPNPDIETDLANLLLEQGRIEEAIRYYREVVQLQPSSALAHYNLAVGLHRLGRLSEAIVHYKEALAIEPGYPDAESFLGQALLQNGQADEAKPYLGKR